MSLSTMAGVVSGVSISQNITVSTTVSPNSNTATSEAVTHNTMHFRIDNRPAYMKTRVNLTNGDIVTAAGHQKGEFEVIAFHNHTTKTVYCIPSPNMIAVILCVVIGVFMLWLWFAAVICFGMAVYYWLQHQKVNAAWAMVKNALAPA